MPAKRQTPCASLLERLASEDVARRRRAMTTLQQPAFLDCLAQALSDDTLDAGRHELILEILYRARLPESVPLLIQQAASPRPRIRALAAEALGAIGDPAAGPVLLDLLGNQEPVSVRDTAALSLGLIGYAAAKPRLLQALTDPAPTVRRCAAQALRLLGGSEVANQLRAAASSEQNHRVRREIEAALEAVRAHPQW